MEGLSFDKGVSWVLRLVSRDQVESAHEAGKGMQGGWVGSSQPSACLDISPSQVIHGGLMRDLTQPFLHTIKDDILERYDGEPVWPSGKAVGW